MRVTHSDNDHYSVPTCLDLVPVTTEYHSTPYVASLMESEKMPAHGHAISDTFQVGSAHVTVTPADHAWQNANPRPGRRIFQNEDACGFWIETPDGTIWAPGDSRLIPEHHLTMRRRTHCSSIFLTASGISVWLAPLTWPTPIRPLTCCSTTGDRSTRLTSHPSTGTLQTYTRSS